MKKGLVKTCQKLVLIVYGKSLYGEVDQVRSQSTKSCGLIIRVKRGVECEHMGMYNATRVLRVGKSCNFT